MEIVVEGSSGFGSAGGGAGVGVEIGAECAGERRLGASEPGQKIGLGLADRDGC